MLIFTGMQYDLWAAFPHKPRRIIFNSCRKMLRIMPPHLLIRFTKAHFYKLQQSFIRTYVYFETNHRTFVTDFFFKKNHRIVVFDLWLVYSTCQQKMPAFESRIEFLETFGIFFIILILIQVTRHSKMSKQRQVLSLLCTTYTRIGLRMVGIGTLYKDTYISTYNIIPRYKLCLHVTDTI